MAGPTRRPALAVGALLTVPVLVVVAGALGLAVLLGYGGGDTATTTTPTVCGLRPAGDAGTLTVPMTPGSFRLTSGFGPRTNPVTGVAQGHRGQDLAAPAGTPITAAAAGVVVEAGPAAGFGQWIVLDHRIDGRLVSTVYGHMWPEGVGVTTGQQVQAGQVIGRVGSNGQSTGPHLHFEVWEDGRFGGRAVDPVPVLAEPGAGQGPVEPSAAPVLVAQAAGAAGAAAGPVPTAAELMPQAPTSAQRGLALTEEQLANAGTIVGVGKGMGLPPRAWVIAIATALQESVLINLDYGDRDSVGLFQQRPSQGWGTVEQIMDPQYSAREFYDAFADVAAADPQWQTRPLTQVAQRVQRSGFPEAYAKWETVAVNAVLTAYGVAPVAGPAPLSCL